MVWECRVKVELAFPLHSQVWLVFWVDWDYSVCFVQIQLDK